MKIIIIHYSAPPVVGGVESVLAHHARLMANAGHEVRVVVGRGATFDRRVQVITLPLVDSKHTLVLDQKAHLDHGVVPPSFAKLVAQIKQRLEPVLRTADVVIAHNVCSLHKNLSLTAALYEFSQQAGAPRFILWQHDLASTSERYRGELHAGYPWDLLSKPWPGAKLVTISAARQRQLSALTEIPPDQIAVVPNGIDLFANLKLGTRTRGLIKDLDLFTAAPILLLPVRITRRKNIEFALRALAELRRSMPLATLVVTGPVGAHNPQNQQYFDELRGLRSQLSLEGSAHFLAERIPMGLSDDAVADLYRFCDALILPSREEGFGIPILEAGAVGMPIFAADIPTLRELAPQEASFFSLQAGATEVADLIAGQLSKSAVYRQKARVRQEFSWQAIYARHLEPLLEEAHAA